MNKKVWVMMLTSAASALWLLIGVGQAPQGFSASAQKCSGCMPHLFFLARHFHLKFPFEHSAQTVACSAARSTHLRLLHTTCQAAVLPIHARGAGTPQFLRRWPPKAEHDPGGRQSRCDQRSQQQPEQRQAAAALAVAASSSSTSGSSGGSSSMIHGSVAGSVPGVKLG